MSTKPACSRSPLSDWLAFCINSQSARQTGYKWIVSSGFLLRFVCMYYCYYNSFNFQTRLVWSTADMYTHMRSAVACHYQLPTMNSCLGEFLEIETTFVHAVHRFQNVGLLQPVAKRLQVVRSSCFAFFHTEFIIHFILMDVLKAHWKEKKLAYFRVVIWDSFLFFFYKTNHHAGHIKIVVIQPLP